MLKGVTARAFKYGLFIGLGLGIIHFAMLASYALGFWFGSYCAEGTSRCLNEGNPYSAGDVIVVFFTVLVAGFNSTQLAPSIKKIS